MLLHSQSFEFVLQAELDFFGLGDAHFVPTAMRHLGVNLLLQLPMFIREFPDVTLYGHRFNLTVQDAQIRSLIASVVTPFQLVTEQGACKPIVWQEIFKTLGEVLQPS